MIDEQLGTKIREQTEVLHCYSRCVKLRRCQVTKIEKVPTTTNLISTRRARKTSRKNHTKKSQRKLIEKSLVNTFFSLIFFLALPAQLAK